MSFLNKFKLNYNLKLIDENIEKNNNEQLLEILRSTKKKNADLYFSLFNYLNQNYSNTPKGEQLILNKYSIISSFLEEDQKFITDFLNFYFTSNHHSFLIESFSDAISADLESFKFNSLPNQISFEQIVMYSDFFLNSLLLNTNEDIFLNSCSAFFESNNSKYFIYPNRTRTYIFIHDHPFNVYFKLKRGNDNQQQALNELFDFDKSWISEQNKKNKFQIYENRQSWNIHSNSWLDPNVQSAYNGFIISMNELRKDPVDILTNLIFHLKQSGLPININYETIELFCEKNKLEIIDPTLSNKEKKLINNNLDTGLINRLDYEI